VDQYGSGTLQLGPKTYTVHSDPAESGGVEFGAIYDPSELHVECLAPWPADVELVELPASAAQPCFDGHLTRRAVYDVDEGVPTPLLSRDMQLEAPAKENKRQVTCMPVGDSRLVGNGNPHQNYQHTQISVRFSAV
jgi:hypothetical protein